MQFPVMTVTTDGKNLMSEAVQSGAKINFDKIIISGKTVPAEASIEDIEALTYEWFTTGAMSISGDATKVTLQTDDSGKSFINVSGEIFSPATQTYFYVNSLAITARIGAGPLKLFGISRREGQATVLSLGTSGTTKIHVSANISTASVGGDIIAYTFDSNYVTGDDFDMLSQTLRSDIEVTKRSDLANRHYYNNPLDAVRYSSHMNSFKLRSGLYPELSLDMKGDSTNGNNPLTFTRLEHERCSLVLGCVGGMWWGDPQICVSGTFIKADGTVVAIQDRLDNLTAIETSALYQDTFPQGGSTILVADILVSYDDTTLDTELILEFSMPGALVIKLVASINPRTGTMNWIRQLPLFKSTTSIGYLDLDVGAHSSYTYRLYKNVSNKQDASRFAYIWTDRELAPGVKFGDCELMDIVLFNNEPYLILQVNDPDTDDLIVFAVPHDLINDQSVEGSTIHLTGGGYDWRFRLANPRSNYLVLGGGDFGAIYSLLSPFKSIPNDGTYEITDQTVITDYGYKRLDSDSEFVTTPSAAMPNTDYTVLCKQRVDTDIKYVVCNGRLIPHID